MAREKYDGWTNYETWCLNRWIDGTEWRYYHWRDAAEVELKRANGDKGKASAALSVALADAIQESAPKLEPSFYSDVLRVAVQNVDWHEIAEYWIDGVADGVAEGATAIKSADERNQ